MPYVYAITDEEGPLDPMVGPQGADVTLISERGLAAAVSEGGAITELTDEQIWGHESVVEALMERGAVLPMRLGTVLADEAAVRELLRARHLELAVGLDRIRGAVELAVRAAIEPAVSSSADPATALTGTDYLLSRLDAQRRTEAAMGRIHRPLESLSRESAVRIGDRCGGRIRASYLVDREQVPRFRELAEALERDGTATALVCTGPWPPYSFVGSEPRR
jgi:gas vesicle protein GvpL/GvpF